jgi:GDP-4-dehydro-6-deoxy-D-mannose reductase
MCSGQAVRIGDILDMVLVHGRVPVTVQVDPSRLRPVDEPILRGDNSRLVAGDGLAPANYHGTNRCRVIRLLALADS